MYVPSVYVCTHPHCQQLDYLPTDPASSVQFSYASPSSRRLVRGVKPSRAAHRPRHITGVSPHPILHSLSLSARAAARLCLRRSRNQAGNRKRPQTHSMRKEASTPSRDLPPLASGIVSLPASAAVAAAARRRDLSLVCDENAVCEERGEAEMRELLSGTVDSESPATSSLGERRLSSSGFSTTNLSPFAVLGDLQGRNSAFGANSDELQRYSSASADLRREREAVLNCYSPGSAALSPMKMASAGPSPLGKRRRASPEPEPHPEPEPEPERVKVARPPPPPLLPHMTAPKPRLGGGSSALFDELPRTLGGAKRGKPTRCRCDRSRCLKRFCVCFAAGEPCHADCKCINCGNYATAHDALELRQRAALRAKSGCNCRKSNCRKRYCECYQAGDKCHAKCRCLDCANPAGVREPGAPPPEEVQEYTSVQPYLFTAGPASAVRVYSHEVE